MKIALITGIAGQDGFYLSKLLIEKGYKVFGFARKGENIDDLDKQIEIITGDLLDEDSIKKALKISAPDEIYNLAGQSDVGLSFKEPELTDKINVVGFQSLVKNAVLLNKHVRIYQAGSAEMFGEQPIFKDGHFNFHPTSPYGLSKVKAYRDVVLPYREKGIFISCGILFNHESPRRGENFVTKKISLSMAKIKLGLIDSFQLGNLDTVRDWGYAGDFVEAMWLMLQKENPKDFVIATGEEHSVRDFVNEVAIVLNMQISWQGEGVNEKAFDESGQTILTVNKDFYRPNDNRHLSQDRISSWKELGWRPKTTFKDLVRLMAESDFKKLKTPQG